MWNVLVAEGRAMRVSCPVLPRLHLKATERYRLTGTSYLQTLLLSRPWLPFQGFADSNIASCDQWGKFSANFLSTIFSSPNLICCIGCFCFMCLVMSRKLLAAILKSGVIFWSLPPSDKGILALCSVFHTQKPCVLDNISGAPSFSCTLMLPWLIIQ